MSFYGGVYRLRVGHALVVVLLAAVLLLVMCGYRMVDQYLQRRTVDALSWILVNKTVVVDAGHGGRDSGMRADTVLEKNINLAIAQRLATYLRQGGAKVLMTRDTDARLSEVRREDLRKRAAMAEENQADAMVSIHANSFSDPGQHGAQTFSQPGSEPSKKLSHAIQAEMVGILGNTDRVPKENDYLLCRESKVPTVIVEVGFLTNPKERRQLRNPSYQDQVAFAIYSGIVKYFAEDATPTSHWLDEKVIETFQRAEPRTLSP